MKLASILGQLRAAVPDVPYEAGEASDQPTIIVPREHLVDTCLALRDQFGLRFTFLSDITAVDWWPQEPRFFVVYHLVSIGVRQRLRLKVPLAGEDARVATVSGVWPAANWLEREVWDLFGVVFEGHPDLRRLLLPEDWEGHPLRKDHPVQIRMAPKTYEPLQLTEEDFRRNLAADRVSRGRGPGS